jgi:hypothetical protein
MERLMSEVRVVVDGRIYTGQMKTKRGLVTVTTPYGEKTTQVGGSPPEITARTMLRELVKAEKARKDPTL